MDQKNFFQTVAVLRKTDLSLVRSVGALLAITACCSAEVKAQWLRGVDGTTGVKIEAATDFVDPAGHLTLERRYTSASVPANPMLSFGGNWRHSFEATLAVNTLFIRANRYSGNARRFRFSSGLWAADPDVRERLSPVLNANGATVGWRLDLPESTREYYDKSGWLIRIEYSDGDVLTVTRDASNRVDAVTDRKGRSLRFTYAEGRIDRVQLPDGRVIRYGYDANRRLASVGYPLDESSSTTLAYTRYTYTSTFLRPDLLTSVQDESGHYAGLWTYDGMGRVTSSRRGDADGSADLVQYDYGAFEFGIRETRVTSPLGQISILRSAVVLGRSRSTGSNVWCEECGTPSFASRTYDSNGNPEISTGFDGTVRNLDYDARGLLLRDALTSTDSASNRVLETSWHPSYGLPTERRVFDAGGVLRRRTSWTYNDRGQVLSITEHDPQTGNSRVVSRTYCEQGDVAAGACPLTGLLTSSDGARTDLSDVTAYVYRPADDAACQVAPTTCAWRKGDLWKVISPAGAVTETLRYDGAGRVLSMKDSNGVTTDITYDMRGRVIARTVRGSN